MLTVLRLLQCSQCSSVKQVVEVSQAALSRKRKTLATSKISKLFRKCSFWISWENVPGGLWTSRCAGVGECCRRYWSPFVQMNDLPTGAYFIMCWMIASSQSCSFSALQPWSMAPKHTGYGRVWLWPLVRGKPRQIALNLPKVKRSHPTHHRFFTMAFPKMQVIGFSK